MLAIGAHPDDAEYFAGATLAAFAAAGASVHLVICTDGAQGGVHPGPALAERRRGEADRAASALGAGPPAWLGRPDGGLEADEPLRRALVREIRRTRPELVLCHDPTTVVTIVRGRAHLGHSDHRAAGQATLDAIYPRALLPNAYPDLAAEGLGPWWVREIWLFDTATPDHFEPVAAGMERKRAAVALHESQGPAGLVAGIEALENAFDGAGGAPAEAFRRLRLG